MQVPTENLLERQVEKDFQLESFKRIFLGWISQPQEKNSHNHCGKSAHFTEENNYSHNFIGKMTYSMNNEILTSMRNYFGSSSCETIFLSYTAQRVKLETWVEAGKANSYPNLDDHDNSD